MKIKITYDPEGIYNDEPMEAEELIDDYLDANDDDELETFIRKQTILTSLNFIADLWGLNYEVCDIK